MATLEPIVLPAKRNTPFDPTTQRVVAYDRRRDRFVEPRAWTPFTRTEGFLVTNLRNADARIEGAFDWVLERPEGHLSLQTHFAIACAPDHEETFVREWAIPAHVPHERLPVLVQRWASDLPGHETATSPDWLHRLAQRAAEEAATIGAVLSIATEVQFEAQQGTLWDLCVFQPTDGPPRVAEVEVRYAVDPELAPVQGLLRYTETGLRNAVRRGIQTALEANINAVEPLSRLSTSGRAVEATLNDAIRGHGGVVRQLRLSPGSIGFSAAPRTKPGRSSTLDVPPLEAADDSEAPGVNLDPMARRLKQALRSTVDRSDGGSPSLRMLACAPDRGEPNQPQTVLVFADGSGDIPLPEGTPLTMALEANVAGASWAPTHVTRVVGSTQARFAFDVRVSESEVRLRTSVRIADLEVAQVGPWTMAPHPDAPAYQRIEASPFRRIVVSYGEGDPWVSARIDAVCQALGDDVVVDVGTLRREQGRAAVREAIEAADVFVLVWSTFADDCERCAFEWRRAMKVEALRTGFVRPITWQDKAPPCPPELRHLPLATAAPT
ncbi:MAG: toll/interleukin-1 receptor domain-containing protein [Myxococcota bacterium]